MGSANGRHRRPRQAPAIVVAAGVTGSAIAIPLLGASGASAADATTWDRVAECESGGAWSADFGNGFYGGLQLSPETWKAYGGQDYAERADLASRSQQIAVAEKVLEDRGPKAWPSCSVISGLAADGSLPGVDPGTASVGDPAGQVDPSGTGRPASSDPAADDAGNSGERPGKAKGEAKEKTKGEAKGTPSAQSSPSATPSAGTPSDAPSRAPRDAATSPGSANDAGGRHRGTPAAEGSRDAGGDHRESGRHASRGGNGARDTAEQPADGAYTVRPGDSLWTIADAQKVPGGWPALYEANKAVVGSDPDLILPGQSLEIDLKSE
ncbi:transglycosylase family protein [Streptomyces sp. NPDC056347]|uniref:transglycosylase family protein n=1 Tax=Streptomyces sp. NPDC056347 TaxID=3345790 RepID=UPI0035DA18DA